MDDSNIADERCHLRSCEEVDVGLDLTEEEREPSRVVSGGVFRFSEGIQSGDEEDGSGAV